jgi:predicted negative regulator of RcsB-dependent stress response/predicted RNA-binding Zn-ribbon protein involved in translation (DUF1610 family)
MDITFTCGSCGQSIVIDEAGAGQLVDCPKCGATIEVPYKSKSLDDVAMPSLPVDKTIGAYRWLQKALIGLVIGALIVSVGYFAQKHWKDQQTAQVEEAKAFAALVEGHRAEAAQADAERAKQAEEARAAQEAKLAEDKERAAKAQLDAEARAAEAKRAEEEEQQDRLKVVAATGTIEAVAHDVESRVARPIRPIIQTALRQFETALRQEIDLPMLAPRPLLEAATEQLQEALERAVAEDNKVKITNWSWTKDESGLTMTANFVIENTSASDIKDIEITCHHFAPSGTEIDSNTRTIYEIIPVGHRLTVNNFNMGLIHSQVQSSKAIITDYTIMK